jgi:hypothetical protein
VPGLNQLAKKDYDAGNTYADRVHFVHLYVVEPHPQSPDVSPYTGTVWEAPPYSTKRQAPTYDKRVASAKDLLPELNETQLILIDALTPNDLTNPVWCTYGPCPNCAYLIGQDGIIQTTQQWFDVEAMEKAIGALLSEDQARTSRAK